MNNRRKFLRNTVQLAAALGIARFPGGRSAADAEVVTGKTFYIDTAGSNENNGLSPGAPWKDFAPIQRRTFGAGDAILLRRGCTWHEQLLLRGAGMPEQFLVLSAYGEGSRPRIQRNGWPAERCVRLENAAYLKVSSLEVCDAGAGIVLFYDHSYGNRSVYLDDIVAHDFRGLPHLREGKSQSPEPAPPHDRVTWAYGIGVTGVEDTPNNQTRVLTDFRVTHTEVYNTGSGIALDWGNHSCVDGTFTLANKFGDVMMMGLHLHDNTVDGDSFGSLFLTSVTGCVIKDSLIERGARYAAAGTAAMQVMYSKNVTLRNVTIRDTVFNACPDNAGLDFECNNEIVLVENCTFLQNAGPAIEVLATPGNANPFTRGLTVRNCSFEGNNWARKQGSGMMNAQISVRDWDRGNRPTGLIAGNRYKNAPGTVFFGGDGNTTGFELEANVGVGLPIPEPVLLRSWNFDTSAGCKDWCDSTHRNDIGTLTMEQGALQGMINGVDPYLLSPPALGLPIDARTFLRVVLKNGTDGVYGQVYFITEEDPHWDERKHRDFWLYTAEAGFRTYDLEMGEQKDWKGLLRQFRLDPEQGIAKGTFEVKAIQILRRGSDAR